MQTLAWDTTSLQFTPKLGRHAAGSVSNIANTELKEEAESDDFRPPDGLKNAGSTKEDLAALDRLVTYLLGQSNNANSMNLDSWRRSRRASSRGYRQLRSTAATAEGGEIGSNVDTTPL